MGRHKPKEGKDHLKESFLSCFSFKVKDEEIFALLLEVYPNSNFYCYSDFSIIFQKKLYSLKYFKNPKGRKLTERNVQYINLFKPLKPKAIHLAIDGDPRKRPPSKIKRGTKKKSHRMKVEDLKFSDTECNLNSGIWQDSRGNHEFVKKVFGYVVHGITEDWKWDNPSIPLIIDSAVIGKGQNSQFTRVRVKNTRIDELYSSGACEAEQIIYFDLRKNCKKDTVHVVDGGTDTDHFTYCIMHQKDFPNSKIYLKLAHYKTVIDNQEMFEYATTYLLDVKKLNKQIISKAKALNENVTIDLVTTFAVCWGIIIGNDFVWTEDENGKKIYLCSLLRGITSKKLFKKIVEKNIKVIDSVTREDGKKVFCLFEDKWLDLFNEFTKDNIYNKKKKLKYFKVLIEKSEGCLNYFYHPSDEEFLEFKSKKKTRTEGNKRKKKFK